MGIEKIEILVAISELSAKQHCQSSPFLPVFDDQNQGRGGTGADCYPRIFRPVAGPVWACLEQRCSIVPVF